MGTNSMNFDPQVNPYPSARNVIYARNGMVATSQPLAAQAGLDILKKGGNAIDAAIATAACLTVVEPTSNGIGGDAFALIWAKGELHGLNSSGAAPKAISIDKVKSLRHDEMPKHGLLPVTVPGIPGAWAELSNKFGKLSLVDCLAPAIDYAKNGYPISPTLGKFWERAYLHYKKNAHAWQSGPWFDTFAPNNRAPKVGEIWSSPNHAATLLEIGKTKAESFYRGRLANEISKFCAQNGGFLTKADLASFTPQWVKPISVNYRGFDVWEIPPNGQGIVALIALNILSGYNFSERDSIDTYHRQFESMKLAFSSGKMAVTDPTFMQVSVEDLLSEGFAQNLRNEIIDTAIEPVTQMPQKSGTVYLATADADGNMVSFIQSNYMGFGSGVVIPNTGIALQNRGADFSLDPSHPNALVGGKKTYHTIIPGFLTKDGVPVGPFGVMGGYMQPQGHVQVIMNSIDFNLNPQAALDAPRWQWKKGKNFEVEKNFPQEIVNELTNLGHEITVAETSDGFGRGQIIWRNPDNGVLIGGTESRTDGAIASY